MPIHALNASYRVHCAHFLVHGALLVYFRSLVAYCLIIAIVFDQRLLLVGVYGCNLTDRPHGVV